MPSASSRTSSLPLPARARRRGAVPGWAWAAALVLAAAGGAAAPADAAQAGRTSPYPDIPARRWTEQQVRAATGGAAVLQREQIRQGESLRRWQAVHEVVGERHVSRKSRELLRRRGLGAALLRDGGDGALKAAAQVQDTLRVLLVRISFQTNRDSTLTTIAPDGNFVLQPPADPQPLDIDPPPHDRDFYLSHLTGLSEYYRFQSGGRLHIQGDVLPRDPQGSYTVSDVADFGPGAEGGWTLEGLESLVRAMIVSADAGALADGSARLADYDDDDPFTYVIFIHAGSDWQSDINGDSPNDIPTFFISLAEPQPLTSTDSGTGLAGALGECSIIPETTNQDGYPGSIAAALYHEFGHALGLVDVYNTQTATPTAGIWDLMDSGTNLGVTLGDITDQGDTVFVVATGVLPPSLGAWNKWFLGWLQVDEIAGQSLEYRLPAVGVPREQYAGGTDPIYTSAVGDFNLSYPQAWRAGAGAREWFLLENRWVPLTVDETPFLQLSFERDERTGVIQYLAGEKPQGFWRNSGLYDYFMPAGGLLVWHVNADRIEEGLADNAINTQGDGLRLVEADGITDIGILDSYVLGWFGSERDPFGGYDALGNRTGYDDLFVEGFPGSRAWDRSWTGLSLTDVRPNARDLNSVLRFGALVEPLAAGFPWEMPSAADGGPRALEVSSATPIAFTGGDPALVFADAPPPAWAGGSYPACLFALDPAGRPRYAQVEDLPAGAFQRLDGPLAGPCAAAAQGTAAWTLLWSSETGRVGLTELPEDGEPVARWNVRAAAALAAAAIRMTDPDGAGLILVPAAPDTLVLLEAATGQVLQALDLGGRAFAGGLRSAAEGPGEPAVALMQDGWFAVTAAADPPHLAVAFHPYERLAAPGPVRAGLWAQDQGRGLAVFDADGPLGSWRLDALDAAWTVGPAYGLDGPLACEPAVADLDGDGRQDLILATRAKIHAYAVDGVVLGGWPAALRDLFPLPDTTAVGGPLVVADATGDGVDEVYFATDAGHLIGLDAGGSLLPRTPFRWGDRRTGGLAVGPGAAADQPRILWLLSAGGYTGPPLDRQVVGGRVCGYALAPLADGPRTSEWLGPCGGPARSGAVGSLQPLGAAAPAAAAVDRAILYPNPLAGSELTVRFYSAGARPARFGVYTLEGEQVVQVEIPALPDRVNEARVALPQLASGLYVCRLECETTTGRTVRTMTLAVQK